MLVMSRRTLQKISGLWCPPYTSRPGAAPLVPFRPRPSRGVLRTAVRVPLRWKTLLGVVDRGRRLSAPSLAPLVPLRVRAGRRNSHPRRRGAAPAGSPRSWRVGAGSIRDIMAVSEPPDSPRKRPKRSRAARRPNRNVARSEVARRRRAPQSERASTCQATQWVKRHHISVARGAGASSSRSMRSA